MWMRRYISFIKTALKSDTKDAVWYGVRLWIFMAAICLYLLLAALWSAPEFIYNHFKREGAGRAGMFPCTSGPLPQSFHSPLVISHRQIPTRFSGAVYMPSVSSISYVS